MFEWQAKLSVGHDPLDQEHQSLLKLMVDFKSKLPESTEAIYQALLELVVASQSHFFHEEELLESLSYGNLQAHKRIHRNLLAKLQDYLKLIKSEDSRELRTEILYFLEAWWMGHIKNVDRRYAPVFS